MERITELTIKALPEYNKNQITKTLNLLNDGNTVPFVARYRKEMTGSLDEVQIRQIEATFNRIDKLEQRRTAITKHITESGKMTDELLKQINLAETLNSLEDIYLPYKERKATKADLAIEAGLEPFVNWLLNNRLVSSTEIASEAINFVNEDKNVNTVEQVMLGAHEIIAQKVGDDAIIREWVRNLYRTSGQLESTKKPKSVDEQAVYEIYYEFTEPLKKIVPFRTLAINRGEREKILKVKLTVDLQRVHQYLLHYYQINEKNAVNEIISAAVFDGYKRFIEPAISRELRNELTERAETQAIDVFGENLVNLLKQPPLKGKTIMGFDPAYRTGCKLAIIDETGAFKDKLVIYPHPPASQAKQKEAADLFKKFVMDNNVDVVAIGNGTASRESEQFVADIIKQLPQEIFYAMVNESGASVYSASEVARTEFPDFNVEERSAVSIARRLQDPLAELIKIDPKSIGVGQYQHDVSAKELDEQLNIVISDLVNQIGIDLNTASLDLLTKISGLSKTVANNIVEFRKINGKFNNRQELKSVKRLGPKAYEQAIGFLRIPESNVIFDNTDIHPESYDLAKEILQDQNVKLNEVGIKKIDINNISQEIIDKAPDTVADIVESLNTPGRDIRDNVDQTILRSDVLKISDLRPGMVLKGTVRNVIDFGAFVDIGVKQDGLVHISQLADKFVKQPRDVVSVGDVVKVKVLEVDEDRQRIQLTMKNVDE